MTTIEREEPPSLEFRTPDCPICGEPTKREYDYYLCEACCCGWNHSGAFMGWANEDAAQCDVTVRPWKGNTFIPTDAPYKDREFRCLLDKGHEANGFPKHAHPDVNGVLWAKGWR